MFEKLKFWKKPSFSPLVDSVVSNEEEFSQDDEKNITYEDFKDIFNEDNKKENYPIKTKDLENYCRKLALNNDVKIKAFLSYEGRMPIYKFEIITQNMIVFQQTFGKYEFYIIYLVAFLNLYIYHLPLEQQLETISNFDKKEWVLPENITLDIKEGNEMLLMVAIRSYLKLSCMDLLVENLENESDETINLWVGNCEDKIKKLKNGGLR